MHALSNTCFACDAAATRIADRRHHPEARMVLACDRHGPDPRGQLIFAQGSGVTALARCLASDRPFRAPHFTAHQLGIMGELALGAGGVLLLDEVIEFRRQSLRSRFWTWRAKGEQQRPALVLGFHPELAKSDTERQYQLRGLERLIDYLPPIDSHITVTRSNTGNLDIA
jgi:hypothetical protein